MHKLRIQVLMVLLCGVQCSLHGMLDVENEYNKGLLEIVAYNIPHKYKAQRAFAMVDKAYNKIIEDTYRQDKQRLEQELQTLRNYTSITFPEHVYWNKNFNTCAWVTTKNNPSISAEKKLELTLLKLNRYNVISCRMGMWKGYKYPAIDNEVRLFFDKEGGVFCYGFGSFDCDYVDTVLEYSLNSDGKMQRKKCCFLPQYCCKNFLNFPVLLKSILQSTQIKEFVREEVIDKTYKIEGVIIPEDYKTSKQHAFYKDKRLSYDQLNDCLKKVIDERYATQQREKNNNTSQEK